MYLLHANVRNPFTDELPPPLQYNALLLELAPHCVLLIRLESRAIRTTDIPFRNPRRYVNRREIPAVRGIEFRADKRELCVPRNDNFVCQPPAIVDVPEERRTESCFHGPILFACVKIVRGFFFPFRSYRRVVPIGTLDAV